MLTPCGPLSYPHVFKSVLRKDAKPGDHKAWSSTILFSRDLVRHANSLPAGTAEPAQADLSPDAEAARFRFMLDSALAVARENAGPTFTGKIEWITDGKDAGRSFSRYSDAKGKEAFLWLPFRNDIANKGYPDTVAVYINPQKVDNPEKNIRAPEVIARSGKAITDPREIYPGVLARLSIGCFWYDTNGNRGVSFGLNNVQKLGDGPRIDNAKDAKDEFGALPDEPPADMKSELAGFLD